MVDSGEEGAVAAPVDVITLKDFLENIHPSIDKSVSDLWEIEKSGVGSHVSNKIKTPDIRIHCNVCDGIRTFRSANNPALHQKTKNANTSLLYKCGDCHKQTKTYYVNVALAERPEGGIVSKFGERPGFGVPISSRVLRLFGKDREIFLKGRQCENQGLGIGAFAYYRRVVENHKNDIISEIIKVCETVGAPEQLIEELRKATGEISFAKSIETIKTGLPQGLLINGHNPLTALHGALSVGLHNESDEECLEAAGAVRLVLTDLVERMNLLRQENKQLNDAVRLLMAKKAVVTTGR
ncbi:hypothetical protein [Sinorhizobium terangae]|uniref:hypothetical protein n=1 Tax=Sinorhizobium terangae TaxID=110322 RepID=UPI0024B259F7|nr:hypothetical protein [Sinorhizobium terangae]WFU49035.1 hypothetical protein QA637_06425 [Sinorhizobium terangae]